MANRSRLILTIDTNLPFNTLRDVLSDSPSRKLPFARKIINFFLGLSAGARSASVHSGVTDDDGLDTVSAFATATFSGPGSPGDTVTINGVILTAVSSSPSNNQYIVGVSANADAASLANAINNSITSLLSGVVDASALLNVVTISCLLPGYIGNSILISKSASAITLSGSALSGGVGCLPNLTMFNAGYNESANPPAPPLGPTVVNLLSSAPFAILSKSGISDIPSSVITGNVGTSPITGAAITGLTSGEVTGTIYTVDGAGPAGNVMNAPLLTQAVSDMQAAFTDAAGRTPPDFTNLGGGEIGGLTLAPGLYKWGTGVTISNNVTLAGGANDVWIFQISGALTIASAKSVILSGGARARNIFWQVVSCAPNTTSHMEGTILASTSITLNTNASINGRLLAQTNVTLDHNTVTLPS